jgi:hypothetical protein
MVIIGSYFAVNVCVAAISGVFIRVRHEHQVKFYIFIIFEQFLLIVIISHLIQILYNNICLSFNFVM